MIKATFNMQDKSVTAHNYKTGKQVHLAKADYAKMMKLLDIEATPRTVSGWAAMKVSEDNLFTFDVACLEGMPGANSYVSTYTQHETQEAWAKAGGFNNM